MTMGKQIYYNKLRNGDPETLKGHLQSLEERHQEYDKKIKDGYTHYLADKNLQKMKFEKAALKREIETIKQRLEKAAIDEA